jgi:FKBP-type peptidyl-prolyl cis-trans isomerase
MKLIIGFFTCFALLSGYAYGSNTGWLWYNYFPWVYSEDEGNWLYIQTQGDQILAYSARDKVWREFESKASERSKYLNALGAREGIIKDSSGLFYEYMKEGSGEKPTMSDEVTVHYHGTLVDGTVFDSSVQRGSPSSFPMNGVIAGFSTGLTKLRQGGKIRLYIPPSLAYGDNPRAGGVIKPGDILIFEVELLAISQN